MTSRPAPASLLTRAEAAYEWLRQHADVVEGESSFQLVTGTCMAGFPVIRIDGSWGGWSLGYEVITLDGIHYDNVVPDAADRIVGNLENGVDAIRRKVCP